LGREGNDVIRLETSKGNGIENYQSKEVVALQLNWRKRILKKHPMARFRRGPSALYNCHGMIFAAHRTRIEKSSAIQLILEDDSYDEIEMKEVLPGDIVIEPPRGCRRLHFLRGWGHEQTKEVLPRGTGAGGTDGV